ncbi:MAG: hypothetical protein AB2L07_20185 [Thermoanaerobaculaceae bacterium]
MTGKMPHADKPRKAYLKPVLGRVVLRPEEAVLGACKASGDVAPSGVCGATCFDAGS